MTPRPRLKRLSQLLHPTQEVAPENEAAAKRFATAVRPSQIEPHRPCLRQGDFAPVPADRQLDSAKQSSARSETGESLDSALPSDAT
jgi:hypothetical protein